MNQLRIYVITTLLLVTGSLAGCGEATINVVSEEVKAVVTSGSHPWLHQKYWDELAEDESANYALDCAHGIPFLRWNDTFNSSRNPIMVPYRKNDSSRLEDHIWSMMWHACGGMTKDQWISIQ